MKDKGEEIANSSDMDFEVISSYTLDEALSDGVLIAFDQPNWPVITGGKPLVVTSAIRECLTDDQIKAAWISLSDGCGMSKTRCPKMSRCSPKS